MRKRTRYTATVIVVAVITASAWLLPNERAIACSCMVGDLRDALDRAEAAVVATEIPQSSPDGQLKVQVDEVLKGNPGRVLTFANNDGSSCGVGALGSQKGLILDRYRKEWIVGLCSVYDAAELRAAASPLPKPNGDPDDIALVAAGPFGRATLVALDSRGRTIAYGYGDGPGHTSHLAVCARGGYVVDATSETRDGKPGLFVTSRRLPGLQKVWEARVDDLGKGEKGYSAAALACEDTKGEQALLLGTRSRYPSRRSDARLLRIDGEHRSRSYDGLGTTMVYSHKRRTAYIADGSRIREAPFGSSINAPMAIVDGSITRMALSPDQDALAVHVERPVVGGRADHVVARVNVPPLGRQAQVPVEAGVLGFGEVWWDGNDTIVASGAGAGETDAVELFDRRMRRIRNWEKGLENAFNDAMVSWGGRVMIPAEGALSMRRVEDGQSAGKLKIAGLTGSLTHLAVVKEPGAQTSRSSLPLLITAGLFLGALVVLGSRRGTHEPDGNRRRS